jgi:lysophospholipase L1-like esterase
MSWRWTIRSRDAKPRKAASEEPLGRLVALAVTFGSAIIVVTCNASRDHARTPPAAPATLPRLPPTEPAAAAAPSATENAAPPMEPPSAAAAEADEPDAEPPAEPPQPAQATRVAALGHELDNFYADLRGLEKHTRSAHVRAVWLGDSHGASDFWSGALRSALQKRFGNGGFGFVHIGNRGYRHDGIKMEIPGKWRTRPRGPASSIAQGDGVFGLSGMLLGSEEPNPRASLTVADQPIALPPSLTWDFCYRLASPRDEIALTLTGASPAASPVITVRASAAEPPGVLRHLVLTSQGANPTLSVTLASGLPELCGVVIEADPKTQPGVVVDTLGINGARLTTPLAWDDASWTSELARRAPSLMILEYGTNEASDLIIKPERYRSQLARLMARVHTAAPSADCLVLAPTDRADTLERTALVRDALKEAARGVGCGFWDTYAIMGGKGSILNWRAETPPRAAPDGVHLVLRGYRELGDKLASDILAAFVP